MRGFNNIVDLDIKERGSFDENPGNFIINDINLYVPPSAISVHKEGLEYSYKSLRTRSSTKIVSGAGIFHTQVKIVFPQDSIVQLHRLICQVRNNPFVSVENKFLHDSLSKTNLEVPREDAIVPITFTVMGIHVTNHPSSPNAFNCELDLRYFNYEPYVNVFSYKKDYLSTSDGKVYCHGVFSDSRVEVSGYDIRVAERNINVLRAKTSNAYKRYSNYLQVKALRENFGIEFVFDKPNPDTASEDVIYVNSKLRSCFETGHSKGRALEVKALHEVMLNEAIDNDFLNFRNQLITKMLKNSSNISFSYREFRRVNLSLELQKKLNDVIDGRNTDNSIKGKTLEEISRIKKENFKKLEEALKDLNFESRRQIPKPSVITSSDRDISLLLNEEPYKGEYYPATLLGRYEGYNEVNTSSVKVISKASDPIPVFAIKDGRIDYKVSGEFTLITNDGDQVYYSGENIIVPEQVINFYNSGGNLVRKGDILGFLTKGKDFQISSREEVIEGLLNISKDADADEKIIGELTRKDLIDYLSADQALKQEGYYINFSRPSVEMIYEKAVTPIIFQITTEQDLYLSKTADTETSLFITGVSGGLRHLMASIPILGQETPTHQFLGSIEPSYQISTIGQSFDGGLSLGIRILENIRSVLARNAKQFSYIPDSANLSTSSFLTQLFGSEEYDSFKISITNQEEQDVKIYQRNNFTINSIDTFTVEGSPGATGAHIRLSESKSFYEEDLKPVRYKNSVAFDTKKAISKAYDSLEEDQAVPFRDFYQPQEADYQYRAWRTKYFSAGKWYLKATSSGKNHLDLIPEEIDKNGYLFCLHYLDKIQEFLKHYKPDEKYSLVIKNTGSYDSPKGTHRKTLSNHFANVAADILVENMNVKEFAAILKYLLQVGYLTGGALRNDPNASLSNAGLGIYGSTDSEAMSLKVRSNGFIHIDANFVNIQKAGSSINLEAVNIGNTRRRWVGQEGYAAFRNPRDSYSIVKNPDGTLTDETKVNLRNSSNEFWGTIVDGQIQSITGDLTRALESLKASIDEVEAQPEDQEENLDLADLTETESEAVSGEQNSFRQGYDFTSLANINELFNDGGFETSGIEYVSYEELSDEQKTALSIPEDQQREFLYISVEGLSDRGDSSASSSKFDQLKTYLQDRLFVKTDIPKKIRQDYSSLDTVLAVPVKKIQNLRTYSKRSERELAVDKLLSYFPLLASIMLSEVSLYSDNPQEEIKRIRSELGDLKIEPFLYSFLLTILGAVPREESPVINLQTNQGEFVSGGDYKDAKVVVASTAGGVALGVAGGIIAGSVIWPAVVVGGVTAGGIAVISNLFEEEQESYLMQLERINAAYKKIALNNPEIINAFDKYKDQFTSSDFDNEEYAKVLQKLGDATTVFAGISEFVGILLSKSAIFGTYKDLSAGLESNAIIDALINPRKLEEGISSGQKFFGKNLLRSEVNQFLAFLFNFPEIEELINESEFVDIFNLENGRLIALDDGSNTLGQIESFNENTDSLLKYQYNKDISEVNLNNIYFNKYKDFLRAEQDRKVSYLKQLLEALLKEKMLLAPQVFDNQDIERQTVDNIFKTNAYPDIYLPKDPRNLITNAYLSPVFYYGELISEEAKQEIENKSQKSIESIISNSIAFQKDLSNGIYAGPKIVSVAEEDVERVASDTLVDRFDESSLTPLETNPSIVKSSLQATNIEEAKRLKGEIDSLFENNKILNIDQSYNFTSVIENSVESLKAAGRSSYESFYKANDMIQAFPTFKLYIIREDKVNSDEFLVFDDFFYYNSVVSFRFHNSRELPASSATIQLQNISGTLDGSKKLERRDIDVDPDMLEADAQLEKIDTVILRPGVTVQLRAGYNSDASELDVLLNGSITEVEYSADNMLCNIVVQSFGVELQTVVKNESSSNNNTVYENTAQVLAAIALSSELKHFGKIREGKIIDEREVGEIYLDTTIKNSGYDSDGIVYGLSFFEEYSGSIAFALAAIPLGKVFGGKLLGSIASKFPNASSFVSTASSGVTEWSKRFWGNLTSKGLIGRGIGLTADTAGLIYRGTAKGVDFIFRGDRFSLLANHNDVNIALNVYARGYSAYRLLGYGRIGSYVRSLFNSGRALSQTEISEIINVYNVKVLNQYGATFSSTIGAVFNGGFNIGTILNPGNVVGKTVGIYTAGASLGLLIGGVVESISYLINKVVEYFDLSETVDLRKRLLLSPTDDNLFPPNAKSYITDAEPPGEGTIMNMANSVGNALYNIPLFGFGAYLDTSNFKLKSLLSNRREMSRKMLFSKRNENEFIIQNQTSWNVLRELTLRHPGYVYGVRPYGNNFEYRVFFGLPSYNYFSKELTSKEAKRINELEIIKNRGVNEIDIQKLRSLFRNEYKTLSNQKEPVIKEQLYKVALKELLEKTKARFTPYRKYHLITSKKELIKNSIICSSHNVINTVKVHFSFDDEKGEYKNETADHASSIFTHQMKASGSIPPNLERPKTVQSPNIRGIGNANRYGLGELLYGMKAMYEGSLLVMGNTKVNPHDIIILKDDVTNMYGPVEVKSVTHMLSHETGFLTDIEVEAFVSANDPNVFAMLEQSIIHGARAEIFDEYTTRNSLLFNTEDSKEKIREVVKSIVDEQLSPENSSIIGKTVSLATAPGIYSRVLNHYRTSDLDEAKEKLTEAVTNRLFEYYNNPSTIELSGDILVEGDLPREFISDIISPIINGGALTVAAAGAAGLAEVASLGMLVNPKAAIGTLFAGLLAYGANRLTGALTSPAVSVAQSYGNSYIKNNIIRPQILAKTSEESVIKVFPLIKDGKPLVAGGLESITENERWNRVLGNFYNNLSDAAYGVLSRRAELTAAGKRIIAEEEFDRYSFAKGFAIDLADYSESILGYEDGELVGYFYGEEE